MKRIYIIFSLVGLLFMGACSGDLLDTKPSDSVSFDEAEGSLDGMNALLEGMYRHMNSYGEGGRHDQFGTKAVDLVADLAGEDMPIEYSHWFGTDYKLIYPTIASYSRTAFLWNFHYKLIDNANRVLTAIEKIEVTEAEEPYFNQIKGEASALRAWAYFRLIRLYQHTYDGYQDAPGVPLYTTPTDITTKGKARGTVADVYTQIVSDMDIAVAALADASGRNSISRINLAVAQGIYARVALEMRDWTKAASMAKAARADYSLMSASLFTKGFDNVKDFGYMWGFEVNDEQSGIYASFISHIDYTVGGYAGLGYSRKLMSSKLYATMVDGDVRKELVDPANYRNKKYNGGEDKGFSADNLMMRGEEMLLIEAEAEARLTNDATAQTLIKELRDVRYNYVEPAAGPTSTTVTETGAALVDLILLERRIELWGEGFRMFDIKRNKETMDRTGSNHKANYNSFAGMTVPAESRYFRYAIPQDEIDANDLINAEDQNE